MTTTTHPPEVGLGTIFNDERFPRSERLTRLQGWRNGDARQADASGFAQRLAPALCGLGAFAGVLTGSAVVYGLFAAGAMIGVVAANHPFETLYNRWATSHGRTPLPPNRAAKRLGCAMGVGFLGGAAGAAALGASTLALVLGLMMAVTATFVATTGICVPSIVFTLLWGAHRGTAPTLGDAARMPRR